MVTYSDTESFHFMLYLNICFHLVLYCNRLKHGNIDKSWKVDTIFAVLFFKNISDLFSTSSYRNAIPFLMLFSCIFQKRSALEESNQLELRVSALDEDLEDMETSDEEEVVVR